MIKYFLLLSLSLTAMGADSSKALKADEKLDLPPMSSKYCMVFDKVQGFVRCESVEIICYSMGKSFSQCFPKSAKTPEAPTKATSVPAPIKK